MRRFRRFATLATLAAATLALAGPPAAAREADEINVFAWDVTPPQAPAGQAPDVLVGTMHVPLPKGMRLPAAVLARVDRARVFASECDLHQVKLELLAKHMLIPWGQPGMDQTLGPKLWNALADQAEKRGVPLDLVTREKPIFLWVQLTSGRAGGGSGSADDSARPAIIDDLLTERAASHHVPLAYMETADDQLAAFESIGDDEAVAHLRGLLASASGEHPFDSVHAYMTGDIASLLAWTFNPTSMAAYPNFYQKVFYNRNQRWLPHVEELFKPGGAVLAVGLGHLIGDYGLLTTLKNRGYQVTPIAL